MRHTIRVRQDKALDNMVEASYAKIKVEREKTDPRFKEVKALRPIEASVNKFQDEWSVEELNTQTLK